MIASILYKISCIQCNYLKIIVPIQLHQLFCIWTTIVIFLCYSTTYTLHKKETFESEIVCDVSVWFLHEQFIKVLSLSIIMDSLHKRCLHVTRELLKWHKQVVVSKTYKMYKISEYKEDEIPMKKIYRCITTRMRYFRIVL